MLRYSFFIVLMFGLRSLQGQRLDSAIRSTIRALQQQKVDTILEVRCPDRYHSLGDDSVPGLGVMRVTEVRYLFYKSNNSLCSRKFLEHCNADCSDMEASVSRRYETMDDPVFPWLATHLDTLRLEDLAPFIYKIAYQGRSIFWPLVIDHEAWYDMEFYVNRAQFGKAVNPADLQKANVLGSENLNYAYNHGTRLCEFFYLITACITQMDGRYIFSPHDVRTF